MNEDNCKEIFWRGLSVMFMPKPRWASVTLNEPCFNIKEVKVGIPESSINMSKVSLSQRKLIPVQLCTRNLIQKYYFFTCSLAVWHEKPK